MDKKTVAEKFDWFFNKLLPKKFIVFVVSTVIIFAGLNPPTEYWYIVMAYYGANLVGKFANKGQLNG